MAWESLRNALIFKGARILNLHLGNSRLSLDIDSNVAPEFVASTPDLRERAAVLEREMARALRRHFEARSPVKYTLGKVSVDHQPPERHPQGWNAFLLWNEVRDNTKAAVRGLPSVQMDVSASETLGPNALEWMDFQGVQARDYALHRIAGEKLRAYLSSLPAYRRKMRGGNRDMRVKDLHDIARILRRQPDTETEFWTGAGREFQLACQSRLVDCRGLETFMESWDQARERYQKDRSLDTVSSDEAENALKTVVGLLEGRGLAVVKINPDAFHPDIRAKQQP